MAPSEAASPMTAPALLHHLRKIGVVLRLGEDGGLRYVGPKGVMTDDLAAQLKARKEQLLRMLGPDRTQFCYACGEELLDGQVAGEGALWTPRGLFHIATCLPAGLAYNPETGTVGRASS